MKLAYLYSRYPVVSQTFCDMEMLELERRGYKLVIGSVHPPLSSLRHEHSNRFVSPVSALQCLFGILHFYFHV